MHNADIDRVAADQGYTTVTLWSGTIGDSSPENEANLVANAARVFQPQRLTALMRSRKLQTVTLNDVFG